MQLLIPLYLQLLSLTVTSSNNVMMRDSPTKCGDLTIPYPFSIGLAYTNHEDFLLICNDTFNPPRTFIRNIASQDIEVVSLNPFKSTATIKSPVARLCDTSIVPTTNVPNFTLDLSFLPYTISSNSNKLIALGCNAAGIFDDQRKRTTKQIIGCTSMCTDVRNTMNGMCSGSGCCEISIPSELQHLIVSADVIVSNKSDTYGNVTPCSYAFLIDQSQYEFTALDLTNFYKRETVPVVLDWVLMDVDTCDVIFRENPHNLCGDNADCLNSDIPAGYRCICKHGFNGNPYVPKGCNQDINECDDPIRNSCSDICINTRGSYYCSCPHGYKGDGKRSGSGCYKYAKKLPLINLKV